MDRNSSTERTPLTSLSESFERYLQDKGKGRGGDGGNYRRNAARELERFAEWAAGDRGDDDWTGIVPDDVDRKPTFDDLDERVFREYARHLSGDRGLKQNTVQTYYRYISAWCVELRMPVKTFTGSTLFGPVPDRNSRDYALIAIIQTELL